MAKLVVLKFNGSLESGFLVNLEIGQEGKSAERGCVGSLPPAVELSRSLAIWQQQYNQLGNNHRIKPQQIIYDGSLNSHQQVVRSANKLQQELDQWLNCAGFNLIDKQLREELNRQEVIRILICSDRPEIYQLPWCCWDLVENYPNLEIAVSNLNFARVPIVPIHRPRHNKVRILAIFGNSQGINLEIDRLSFDALKDGEVKFLIKPTPQELDDCLWQKTWDIIFFAGHSKTLARQGILYLNTQDRLTIEQLRHGFKQAIASGLQLAIFNSCDGLGLAEELGQLSLPQSIVMRMPIPDVMAQHFVKYFLQAYAGGNSLYIATKKAREQLQSWEKQFPCASWLPTIHQNPAVIPPDWSDLRGKGLSFSDLIKFPTQRLSISIPLLISAIATIIVWSMQSWGWLQAGELNNYDRMMGWQLNPPINQRVLVITIDDEDRTYQREQGMFLNMRGSLADAALNQLIVKLQSGQAKAIASDVIHDFPFDSQLANTIAQTDNFLAICRVKIDQPELVSIAPPSQLSPQQVGFSNWAIDDDGTVRRQILGMSPDSVCQSDFSLSLRLALKYLDNVSANFNSQGMLQIGNTVFPKLGATSGGYHLPEAQGYQILLNCLQALPQTISLREILTMPEKSLATIVKDKLILIGVVGYNQDLHLTPYSKGQQAKRLPGVVVHAQMTNQIVDAVLGEQKLLWWLSDRVELLWIAAWSLVGSAVVIMTKRSLNQITLRIAASLLLLLGCCWLLFLAGGWIVAIAPALSLMLSAAITAVYLRN